MLENMTLYIQGQYSKQAFVKINLQIYYLFKVIGSFLCKKQNHTAMILHWYNQELLMTPTLKISYNIFKLSNYNKLFNKDGPTYKYME